jgi:hypothetical protein
MSEEGASDFGGPKSVWASPIIPLLVIVAAVALSFFGVVAMPSGYEPFKDGS